MASLNNLTQQILGQAVIGFTDYLFPVSAFCRTNDGEGKTLGMNDVVKIPLAAALTSSSDFTYANGFSGNNGNYTGKTLTINVAKYQPFDLTDTEAVQIDDADVQRHFQQLGRQLAADFVSASIYPLINSFSGTTVSASFLTASSALASLDKVANDLKWPDSEGERHLFVNTTGWSNLMNNSNVIVASNFGFNSTVMQDGKLRSALGFTPHKLTNLSPTFNGSNGFITNPNAFGLTTVAIVPQENNVVNFMSAKAANGITLCYYESYDPNKLIKNRRIAVFGGAVVVDPNGCRWLI